ncbi:hypothetical protein RHGRI_016392 [Rhododendron griersonianum]|uniref:Uncharacterized protein n=1 Tax=Rhododendron griersonianum TaxID=479676 RepID=A0AAV6JTY9_9ERIC|nr:hypothetical protein RHGRI_016392 [Rhododendron griersonianum]
MGSTRPATRVAPLLRRVRPGTTSGCSSCSASSPRGTTWTACRFGARLWSTRTGGFWSLCTPLKRASRRFAITAVGLVSLYALFFLDS